MTAPSSTTHSAAEFADALREIASLAASPVSESAFFRQFLEHCLAATGATSAAIWLLSDEGLLARACQAGATSIAGEGPNERRQIQELLDAVQTRETVIHAAQAPLRGADENSRLLSPLLKAEGCAGIVELVLAAPLAAAKTDPLVAFVEEANAHATRFLRWKRESASQSQQLEFWTRFQSFALALQQTLDLDTISHIAVNDARPLIGCDRLSIVLQHGPHYRLVAVSGQEQLDHRSHTARATCRLGELSAKANQEIVYTGDLDELPEPVAEPLLDFVRQTGARALKVMPLASEPSASDGNGEKTPDERPQSAFGALIVEHFSDAWIDPLTSQKAAVTAQHVAAALANARTHSRIFLRPLWVSLGNAREWVRGRRLRKITIFASCLAMLISALAFIPASYRVEGTGLLMPARQQRIFAPQHGEITEIFIESGQKVQPGDVLLRIRNDALDAELLGARNQLEELRQRHAALQAEIDKGQARTDNDAAIRLRGRLAQTEIEIRGAAEQVHALERQLDQLTIRAPIVGTVATFNIGQRLLHRPVQRGDLLLDVMDETGPWQLELEVPEYRAGHLLGAATQLREQGIPLEFVLATHPETTWTGQVNQIARRADESPTYGSSVRVMAVPDAHELPPLHIGAQARARMNCGSRSLAFVLFGDLLEYVQQRVW